MTRDRANAIIHWEASIHLYFLFYCFSVFFGMTLSLEKVDLIRSGNRNRTAGGGRAISDGYPQEAPRGRMMMEKLPRECNMPINKKVTS